LALPEQLAFDLDEEGPVKIYHAKLEGGNFGDDLNPWIWDKLMPGVLNDDNSELFVGIGTILNSSLNNKRRKVVFGTGTGYGPPPKIDHLWRIYCVRGPLTAEKLRLDPKLAITDAAYVLRFLDLPPISKKYAVSFVCHHASASDVCWNELCERAGVHFISPMLGVEQFLAELLASDLVIAEAMHAAIVADAFRIPWIPLRYGYRSFDFKWHDWCRSVGLEYNPIDFPPILQADLNRSEALARMLRRGLATLGIGKEKWRRTPLWRSSSRELDQAAKFLHDLPVTAPTLVSPDAQLSQVMERLEAKFHEMRHDLLP
jgi:succinoglycan biosynthesis protein ExoV